MHGFRIRCGAVTLDLSEKTCIMGILNTTPDSFSDGGQFDCLDTAVVQGLKLVEDGAAILDIGGESSRPFAEPVSEEEEKQRVVPVIKALATKIDVPISIDTVKPGVAQAALDAGAAIINDISAFEKDPGMADLAAQRDVPVILMHMKGTPQTMQIDPDYDDLMAEITDYLASRVEFALSRGVRKENIILDPGIGFGKTVEHNLILIRRLDRLAALGFPILLGPSRKSFIQNVLTDMEHKPAGPDSPRTEYGTLAAVAAGVFYGSHIVRVHDVEKVRPFLNIIDSIQNV
ncbi:MAG: dihydropteroate synthase [Desulfobacteraceae bacterium]|nr:MAG: dihydropteroate synthase [Desulfobacteraceae bacterium]